MRHVFSTHAQLPTGTDIYENYKYITIVIQVDMSNEKICDCVVPMYSRLQNKFVADIFMGRQMSEIDKIIDEIDEKIHTPCKRALITAVQALVNGYIIVRTSPHKKGGSEESLLT